VAELPYICKDAGDFDRAAFHNSSTRMRSRSFRHSWRRSRGETEMSARVKPEWLLILRSGLLAASRRMTPRLHSSRRVAARRSSP
jgi:hypothetical protein